MKKASIRFLSAILAILLLVAMAGCTPSTDTSGSTEAGGSSRPDTVISTENNTTDSTENNTTDSTENNTTDSTENNTTDSTEGSSGIEILYENSFDDSAALNGWKDKPAAGLPEGSTIKVNDAGQLEIYAATKDAIGKTYGLKDCAGKITFEFDITCSFLETTPSNRTSGAFIVYVDNMAAVCVYFYPEGFGFYNVDREPTPGATIFGTCNGDQTYHVTILADTDTELYDFYIDGELAQKDVKFRNSGDAFTKIECGTGGNSVGVTVKCDNLKIFVTEE